MGNYFKIYLLFLIPSCLAIGFGFYTNYSDEVKAAKEEFELHYNKHTQIYADQIKEIEKFYDLVMLNAISGIRNEIHSKNISRENLTRLSKKYNVTHLFVIDRSGKFLRSTNEPASEIPNLYSFSTKYKKLINNSELEYLATPIILPFPEKEPHKFLVIWTGKYFIEAGVRITEIAKNITKILDRDKNILNADIEIGSERYSVKSFKKISEELLRTTKKIELANNHYVQSKNKEKHDYTLRFLVSKADLYDGISIIKRRYIGNFALTILLIAGLLLYAIKVLRTRVERVTRNLLSLAKNEEYNKDLSYLSSNKDIQNLVQAINRLLLGYRKSNIKNVEAERINTINNLTAQVAHDIRSPLEALKSSKNEINSLNESDRVKLNTAINRIEEIAYSLLKMKKETRKGEKISDLENIVEQILIEKRMQFKKYPRIHVDYISGQNNFGSFAKINPNTLKSILSNLINNSAESLNYEGQIDLSINESNGKYILSVKDNSEGFTESYLENPFIEGTTTKVNGNGLGLFYAKEELDKINAGIKIFNNNGANVEITLESCDPPSYYLTCINTNAITKVIILDDDENIHNVWINRFKNIKVELEHFYSAADLLREYTTLKHNELLLSDFELLGEELNGLDCIEILKAVENSILISARSEEEDIIKRVKEMGVKLLPKNMALNVPIANQKIYKKVVLIDDDDLVHMTWNRELSKKGIELFSYYSVKSFTDDSAKFDIDTLIFVDSNLGENLKGEVLSEEIFKLGFKNLHIATGYSADSITRPTWIKSIQGKRPDEIFGVLSN